MKLNARKAALFLAEKAFGDCRSLPYFSLKHGSARIENGFIIGGGKVNAAADAKKPDKSAPTP